jgi:cell division septal protein FtsQ
MNHSNAETIKIGSGLRGIHFLIGIFLLAALLFLATWSRDQKRVQQFWSGIEFLKVKTIEVQCEWPLEANQVQNWLNSVKGTSIVLVDSKALSKSLEERSWVQSVAIKKGYPSQINISLSSKKPQALVIHKGQSWFVDQQGDLIDKATPQLLKGFELPFLSVESSSSAWEMSKVLKHYEKMKTENQNKFSVSQIVLGKFPYFKTYLSRPKIEVIWSVENWEDQLKNLIALIDNPPSQTGQLRRINLVFPKKAIVSSSISH